MIEIWNSTVDHMPLSSVPFSKYNLSCMRSKKCDNMKWHFLGIALPHSFGPRQKTGTWCPVIYILIINIFSLLTGGGQSTNSIWNHTVKEMRFHSTSLSSHISTKNLLGKLEVSRGQPQTTDILVAIQIGK